MNYNEFKTKCEAQGELLEVRVDVKYNNLTAFGLNDWYAAYFNVDQFGGTAAEIAFIDDNIRYTDDLVGVKFFSRLEDAFELLPMAVKDMQERREGVALAEMANID